MAFWLTNYVVEHSWPHGINHSLLLYVSVNTRLAEIIERETEAYYKMDPDPFDDRHPGMFCVTGFLV